MDGLNYNNRSSLVQMSAIASRGSVNKNMPRNGRKKDLSLLYKTTTKYFTFSSGVEITKAKGVIFELGVE